MISVSQFDAAHVKFANMSKALKRLAEDARRLSPSERTELIDTLLSDARNPIAGWDSAWAAEADRRWHDLKSGKAESYPADQVLIDISVSLQKRRNTLSRLKSCRWPGEN